MTNGSAARTLSLPLRSPLPTPVPKRSSSLRLVPQRRSSAARAPFLVVVVTLLVGGLLGLLLLNTLVAQDSFTLHDLGKQATSLSRQEQELARQVQALQAPAALASRATALGMVPGGPPAFLRLSDGKVLGQPTAGVAPVAPVTRPSVTPSTTPSTKPATTGPHGSTTWTAPRQSPPPAATNTRTTTQTGTHR
ncbi:MAG: hypothetical protein JWM02_197 [Frankiales bacterium]|nr:hypothetical protein [Frankiales bacterium]